MGVQVQRAAKDGERSKIPQATESKVSERATLFVDSDTVTSFQRLLLSSEDASFDVEVGASCQNASCNVSLFFLSAKDQALHNLRASSFQPLSPVRNRFL
jgi:hypothetical protein